MLIKLKVSKMTKVISQALTKKNIEIKEKKKKINESSDDFKTQREGDAMTCCGRLFHTHDGCDWK